MRSCLNGVRLLLVLLLLLPALPVQAQRWAIASAHPLATRAGEEILSRGGNAFDAAVAVAAALAVAEPYGSGLGGGGFFLLHRAADGHQVVVDARETAPAAARAELYLDGAGEPRPRASLYGPLAAGIPGTVAGLDHVAGRYGRLPLAASLEPAIRLARDGFAVGRRYVELAKEREADLRSWPASAVFLDQGGAPGPGWVLRQPELAATLERIAAEGRDGFYRGPVAQQMVSAVRAAGGVWEAGDLEAYRVVEREPEVIRYRGARIVTAPLPSSGGLTLAQALGIVERFDLDALNGPQRMHLVAEAMRRAYEDRARWLGDADFVQVPAQKLRSADYAAERAAGVDLAAAGRSDAGRGVAREREGAHTTHFSIVDAEGNRVAATLTINTLFGSGFVAQGTGVLLNNEMDDFALRPGVPNVYGLRGSEANAIAPGKRPLSSMSPSFVEDGRGVLVVGTPGGSRIVSMVLLAILDYVHGRWTPVDEIVARPRYHHQWLPDRIEVEPGGFAEDWLDELRLLGHRVEVAERRWGNMQAVFVDRASGRARAAGDPRAAVY